MDCPHCLAKGKTVKMTVTNSYRAGAAGRTERVVCPTPACGLVGVVVHVLAVENPVYGDGAGIWAKKMETGDVKVAMIAAATRPSA